MAALQKGFTLIEILIALVILAIGLFGLMMTQSNLLQSSVDNSQRALMVFVGQELIDRIQANSSNSVAYQTQINTLNCGALATLKQCNAETCTGAEMVQYDVVSTLCATPDTTGVQVAGAIDYISLDTAGTSLTCVPEDSATAQTCVSGSRAILALSWNVRTVQENGRAEFSSNTISLSTRL